MYKIKSIKELSLYGFKKYDHGFSKKLLDGFLDISFEDMILKKVHFDGELFVYENATEESIKELIEAKIAIKVQDEEKT